MLRVVCARCAALRRVVSYCVMRNECITQREDTVCIPGRSLAGVALKKRVEARGRRTMRKARADDETKGGRILLLYLYCALWNGSVRLLNFLSCFLSYVFSKNWHLVITKLMTAGLFFFCMILCTFEGINLTVVCSISILADRSS